MRTGRILSGSLLTLAVLAACSDTSQPIGPVPTPDLQRSSQTCSVSDDAQARVRTATAGCTNAEVTLPAGWTLNVVGGAPAAGWTVSVGAQQITQFENPTPEYVGATNHIDLSGIADFTNVTSATDGTQTVSFNVTMQKRSVPGSWGTWANLPFVETPTPHVLFTQGAQSVTMTLSQPSTIFGFELGPNPFAFHTYTADFFSGATLVGSITREISGDNGARLIAARTQGPAFDRVVVTGTADFSIARIRYSDRGARTPIRVQIHDAYSGDPRRVSNLVSTEDEWVYVEILDPLQYRRPGGGRIPFDSTRLRIGRDWATGVPVESFRLLDINGDGKLDIRLRWSRSHIQWGSLPEVLLEIRYPEPDHSFYYEGEVPVKVCQPLINNGSCTLDQHQPHGNRVIGWDQEVMVQSFTPLGNKSNIAGVGIFMPACFGPWCGPREVTLSLYLCRPELHGGRWELHIFGADPLRSKKVMAYPGHWADATWFDNPVNYWMKGQACLVIDGARGVVGSDQNPYPSGEAFTWQEHDNGWSGFRGKFGDWEAVPNSDFMFRSWMKVQ